nr:DUF817 family protein [Streptomyces argyrophyllae]
MRDPGLAAAVHLGFFTHHWLPDLRRPLAVAMTAATAGTRVGFGVGAHRYRMPLAVSSVLIGFFPWVAENAATCAGAWSHPQQLGARRPVPPARFRAWSPLISVTFVLVEHLGTAGRDRRAGLPPVSDSFKTG